MKLALVALAFAAVATPAFAATDYYLSTPVTSSCSAQFSNPGYIEVSSFGISGTDPGNSTTTAYGYSGGKVTLGDFIISKKFDNCSGALVTSFLTGQQITPVTLTGVSSSAGTSTRKVVLSITLSSPIITSYALNSDEEAPEEVLHFHYQKVCIATSPADGSKPTSVCYDSSTNSTTSK